MALVGAHPDRMFPADPGVRAVARSLYATVRDLPIVSPHGHCDAAWFAEDAPFPDPARLLVTPDHYLVRMLYSQGLSLAELGIGPGAEEDPRKIWRRFAEGYHLFRGTPSGMWFDTTLSEVFGVEERLGEDSADHVYDTVAGALATDAFRPRALFDRFGIEFLATTEGPLDDLRHHDTIHASGWDGVVVTTFRPDRVLDPEHPDFAASLQRLGEITGEDVDSWDGYLAALRRRRQDFIARGATATDHGHPTAGTEDLPRAEAERLFRTVRSGAATPAEAERFRGQMLTEMLAMSVDDGLIMQLHPGVWRDHNTELRRLAGPDVGGDIPRPTDFVGGLHALLQRFGNRRDLTLVLFTVDETTYTRELAPLAGHYPLLRLGAPWWFLDSPEGMARYRRAVTETAGFANAAGFTDDTRAFLSLPARHDMARRMDCAFLAGLVAEHRLAEDDAVALAADLALGLARDVYRVDEARARVRARGR